MATTLLKLRTAVEDWIEDTSEPDITDRAINEATALIAAQGGFSQMISQETVTPDDEGKFYLPPRCDKVIDIFPAESGAMAPFVFSGTRRIQAGAREGRYCYRSIGATESPFATVDVDLENGSTTFSQSSSSTENFTEDMVGMEIVVEGIDEVYKILSYSEVSLLGVVEVYPEFRFEDSDSIEAYVRPAGTEQLQVYDTANQNYTGDITIEFRKKHPTMVADNDPLLIPAPRCVSTEAVKFFLRQTKYDVDADRVEREMTQYKAVEFEKQPAKTELGWRTEDKLFSAPGRGRRK